MAGWASAALCLALWTVCSVFRPSSLLPTPAAVVRAMRELLDLGFLFHFATASVVRASWGFAGALCVGVVLGAAMGSGRERDAALRPFLEFARHVSPVAWIPLVIFSLGLGELPCIFVCFISALFPIAFATAHAVRHAPRIYLDAGRNLTAGTWAMTTTVLLPAIWPELVSGMRIALAAAWVQIVPAEMLSVDSGLGFLILDARNAGNRFDVIAAAMVLIAVMGWGMDRALVLAAGAPASDAREGDPTQPSDAAVPRLAPAVEPGAKVHVRDLKVRLPLVGRPLEVLGGIELAVREGEWVCLIGPSGCGKSTLLRAIAGLCSPSAGQVELDGAVVRRPDRRSVLVFQDSAAFPWLTVEENVGFGLRALPPEQRAARVGEWIRRVGLSGFERALPHQLSGGMKQRVELARALAVEPEVLLLDEPFGALDALTRLKMRAELRAIWRDVGKTILFVTHDVDEALQLASRIIVLSERPARIVRDVRVEGPAERDALRATLLADLGVPP